MLSRKKQLWGYEVLSMKENYGGGPVLIGMSLERTITS